MQPDENRPKPSLDGVKPVTPVKKAPELRYNHELPAPEPIEQIEATATPDKPTPNPIGDDEPFKNKKRSWKKRLLWLSVGIIIVLVAAIASAYAWYQVQLSPVSSDTTKHVRVTIKSGTTPSEIANQLKDAGVIRSQLAFAIYTKLNGTQDILKAGAYNLQPSVSTPAIVEHLVSGKQDTFRLTFLPGDTLANNRKKIIEVGYSESEVDAALGKTYDRPLFVDKPAGTDLEGYIFGETYEFDASATAESILNRTFDEYEAAIKESDLVNGFKKQGLNLYQGITMASIVQREVPTSADQAQIARVFLNRMEAGMTLGSDVTYQYVADKTGVERSPNLDSPYNTRKYPGLPPGPIATPGVSALKAVANPATNDYLFFLSGDDNVTYFGKTDAEHQRNIVNHCQKKCLIN